MQQTSYAFMKPDDGRFLRVYHYEDDPHSGEGGFYEFSMDHDEPIYETGEPAALLDTMIGIQNGRYLSEEALHRHLPRPFGVHLKYFVPVAFIRELSPVTDGGDTLVRSMDVRLVRFDDTSDPNSIWLDDIENRFDPNPNLASSSSPR
jgi:hypothetical protein